MKVAALVLLCQFAQLAGKVVRFQNDEETDSMPDISDVKINRRWAAVPTFARLTVCFGAG